MFRENIRWILLWAILSAYSVTAHPIALYSEDAAVAASLLKQASVSDGLYVDTRTVGGVQSEPRWLSSVANLGGRCTGLLIAPQVVLTAGHCGSSYQSATFLLPDSNFRPPPLGNYLEPRIATSFNVIARQQEPGFRMDFDISRNILEVDNDRQLLLLGDPVPTTPLALLYTTWQSTQQEIEQSTAQISGFGMFSSASPEGVQKGKGQSLGITQPKLVNWYGEDRWSGLVGEQPGYAGTLPGDSGGPLIKSFETIDPDFGFRSSMAAVIGTVIGGQFHNNDGTYSMTPGQRSYWEPTRYIGFIQETLNLWEREFAGQVSPGGLAPNVIQNFGKSFECPTGFLCKLGDQDRLAEASEIDATIITAPIVEPEGSRNVPEPATYLLMAFGLFRLCVDCRRIRG